MEVSRASEISVLVRCASSSYEVLRFLDPAVNELLPAVDSHLRCVHAVPPSTLRSTESGSEQCWASRDVALQVTVAE